MASRVILHLDMNAFFASVEQRANPWLRGRPVLVCGNRHSRTVVATASYEARAYGVATGMPLQEALALCPHAIPVEGNPAKYVELFQRVARLMERYSPLLEVFSIDEAFLDLTLTAGRFGGPLAVARALQAAVRARLGLPCSIGLGPNKLLAKLASSLKKPNGLTEIRPEEVCARLAPLPVQELCGIGPSFQRALNDRGILTCGELAEIPPPQLIRWFGRCAGLHLAQLARGLDETPVVPGDQAPAPKSMGHLHTLPHDAPNPQRLHTVLLDLSEKVGRRLRAERAAGRTVTVTLRYRDFSTFSRSRTLDQFLDDGFEIYQAGCRILERVTLAQAVRMVGITVSGLSYGPRQTSWLPACARRAQLLAACDRIRDRFGEGSVMRGALLALPRAASHYQLKRPSAQGLAIKARHTANSTPACAAHLGTPLGAAGRQHIASGQVAE